MSCCCPSHARIKLKRLVLMAAVSCSPDIASHRLVSSPGTASIPRKVEWTGGPL
jgi:hypothetical protein